MDALPARDGRSDPARSQPGRVTGKLKAAIDHLAWFATGMEKAAQHAGMTTYAVRQALGRPHVLAYYRAQCEVIRSGQHGANIRRLCEIRDAADNMPAVNAIKALEQLGEEQAGRAASPATPGLVVVINAGPQAVDAHNVGVSWSSDRKGE